VKSIVWMSESLSRALRGRLSTDVELVSSAREFCAAQRDATTVSFLDGPSLASLDRYATELGPPTDPDAAPQLRRIYTAVSIAPVIVISEEPLASTLGLLPSHPWLSHLIGAPLLDDPAAATHLTNMLELCTAREPKLLDWLRPSSGGRRVMLTHANRREERLERMSQYFAAQSVEGRRLVQLRNATEELLINAFYEAPVAAGISRPIDRTRDVVLPEQLACDIAYGCVGELALVRVRDPFGALKRERFVELVSRRARDPQATETGFWRVANMATILAVSVVKNRHTEVLIAITKHDAERPKGFAMHFAARESSRAHYWKFVSDETGDDSGVSGSITLAVGD
jgi:hypothetical protein